MSRADGQVEIRGARAIVVERDAVLLIERRRAERRYYVFPGGKLEPGETAEGAVVREVEEETGLIVRPDRLVGEGVFPDRLQTFWLATVIGGKIGTGTGPEMTGGMPADRGTYRAVWLPLAQIEHATIYPERVRLMVAASDAQSWPTMVVRFHDEYMWWK